VLWAVKEKVQAGGLARSHVSRCAQAGSAPRSIGIAADYLMFCGEWNIGRIYEIHGGPDHLRWFWALHFPSKPGNLRTDNRVATLENCQGGVRDELEAMEGVGEDGRD
jgi:hypothetical protein